MVTAATEEVASIKKQKFSLIGTHNGQFHCDEALACYMLKLLPEFEHCKIVRTRDERVLDTCDIVVDVGAVYELERMRFDHHQKEFKVTMNNIHAKLDKHTKLSSAGLVYAHFGHRIISQIIQNSAVSTSNSVILSTEGAPTAETQGACVKKNTECSEDSSSGASAVDLLFGKVYENFIEEIDAIDNGVNIATVIGTSATGDDGMTPQTQLKMNYRICTNVSSRVSFLNPNWNESTSDEIAFTQFERAMQLVGSELEQRVLYYHNVWLPARSIVERALNDRLQCHTSGNILLFEDVCPPWKEHLFNLEAEMHLVDDKNKIYYVIYRDSSANGGWRIQCVPLAAGGTFTNRLSLPEKWRGLRDDKLSAESNIEGCIFVHSSGFIGGNLTYEGVMKMAEVSLRQLRAL